MGPKPYDETEITAQWLMTIALRLARDWTWDALTDQGLQVFRSINGGVREMVGILSPRKTINTTAVRRGVALDRSTTDLFFFDAIDPKPAPGEFPREIEVTYTIVPQFRQAPNLPAPEWTDTVRCPIASPPSQVPQMVSAGIALSSYERDETYSKTAPRRRMLWIEFAKPVANRRDAYFARVTMHSADPMLIRGEPARPPGPLEPPLNIEPELIRSIIPNQPEDSLGLEDWQRLTPAEGDGPIRHFLLPLPETLSEASPDLFGFFVYEFCVGHAEGWVLPDERYGPPQRVTGVQHPVPVLTCSVSRTAEHIRVSAPYATPVADGQILPAEPPTSDLWALLYVQVRLADGSDWRNILIGRTRLTFSDLAFRGRSGSEPHGFGYWDQSEIEAWLDALGLRTTRLSARSLLSCFPNPTHQSWIRWAKTSGKSESSEHRRSRRCPLSVWISKEATLRFPRINTNCGTLLISRACETPDRLSGFFENVPTMCNGFRHTGF